MINGYTSTVRFHTFVFPEADEKNFIALNGKKYESIMPSLVNKGKG